jgi:hypothetical protein
MRRLIRIIHECHAPHAINQREAISSKCSYKESQAKIRTAAREAGGNPRKKKFCRRPLWAASENRAGLLNDGQLDAVLDDARANGIPGETGGVVDIQLFHEVFAVFFDSLQTNAKFRRRLLVGFAFGD